MNASEKFTELLSSLAPARKRLGLSKRGQNFYLRQEGNWGVINFQRSVSSAKDRIRFTVNLGIYFQVLAKFFHKWKDSAFPTHTECHWQKRIGHLLSERQDKWWVIDDSTTVQALRDELEPALLVAVSEMEKYIKDEAFRDILLAGSCDGVDSDANRLRLLSVLVNRYGPFECLDIILEQFRSQEHEVVWEGHVKRLEQAREQQQDT